MKKYLEKDMLCEALRGRVSYDFTWYPAFGGLSAVFTVLLNGQPAKKFSAAYAWKKLTEQGFEIRYKWHTLLTESDDIAPLLFSHVISSNLRGFLSNHWRRMNDLNEKLSYAQRARKFSGFRSERGRD